MLKIKYWIRDFFGFPRSQVNGFLVLLLILTVLIVSEPLWRWWSTRQPPDRTQDRAMLDSLIVLWESDSAKGSKHVEPKRFKFDPNHVTEDQFIALGFPPSVATRIIRYREKGGQFRTKSDLLKIYGIDTALYNRINAFIMLPEVVQRPKKGSPPDRQKWSSSSPRVIADASTTQMFDLNKADTASLKQIRGIGEKLSIRIVKYRDVLGGFVSMNQLYEVFGLDSLVVNRLSERCFIEENFQPTKVDVNVGSEKELSAHPYLKKLATAIVAYRFQHGDFQRIEDIRTVVNLDEEKFQRIAPYLTVKGGL